MLTSHITMVLPCAWWVVTEFSSSYSFQLLDHAMAVTMEIAVALSVIYHLNHEHVLCNAETGYMLGATAMLNVYMLLEGVSAVAGGWPFLAVLHSVLESSRASKRLYDERHHICHRIAGVYIGYGVLRLLYSKRAVSSTAMAARECHARMPRWRHIAT